MKRFALFKSDSEDYRQAFREHNYEVVFVEPLQFVFVDVENLRSKLLCKDYDGLILTSPRAIEAVSKCWDPAKFVLWNSKKVYTVGENSGHKIKLHLGLESVGTNSGNAENLSHVIVKDNSENSKFLFPCGNLRSEVLPEHLTSKGMVVDSLTVYETKESDKLKENLMELDMLEQSPCGMVFFSPSGCEYIHRQLQTFSNKLYHLPHFAIGNSTAHKIQNLGIDVAGVAAKPKAESVVESVQSYFTAKD